MLKQAGDNLTRENIMKQAANIKPVALPLLLPGMTAATTTSIDSCWLMLSQLRRVMKVSGSAIQKKTMIEAMPRSEP